MKFCITDFFSKCDQIRRKLCSVFCAVLPLMLAGSQSYLTYVNLIKIFCNGFPLRWKAKYASNFWSANTVATKFYIDATKNNTYKAMIIESSFVHKTFKKL